MIGKLFFLFFIFLKQLYIFPSGSLGLGDICLLISCLCVFYDELKNGRWLFPDKKDRCFWYFVGMAVLVSGVYFVKDHSREYLKYALFWIYNGMFLWCIRRLAVMDVNLLKHAACVMKVNVVFQSLLWVSGYGRVFTEYNGIRYMGSFNDPNQLAFFLFAMMLLLYQYSIQYKDRTYGIYFFLALWLIIQTKSTGILLGVLILTAGIGIMAIKRLYERHLFPAYVWGIGCVLLFVGAGGILWYLWPDAEFVVLPENFTMLNRIREKILILSQGDLLEVLYNRGWDKVVMYPQYLLYGAGEGGLERFAGIHIVTEVHNSLLNIWFCYGVIPMVTISKWCWARVKNTDQNLLVAVVALLIESCFLVNYRQPFFWWILIYKELVENIKELEHAKSIGRNGNMERGKKY